jgi:hypothetical protein
MRSCAHRAPEERRGGLPAEAIALMGSVVVVEAQEPVERALEGSPTGEVATAEDHAPVLPQNRALGSLHEAVGPGMPGLRPRVPDAERSAGVIEGVLELRAPIGQDALDRPAGASVVGHEDRAQEGGHGRRREGRQQPRPAIRAEGIAGDDLPDLPDAFELAHLEGVETDELARPWFVLWLKVEPFKDVFPYGLLTMIVSLEAIFLSTFVMIS